MQTDQPFFMFRCMEMYDVLIIGSGMSGLSCAQVLQKKGIRVLVLDKGYLPGGRTASKTIKTNLGDATFDYGAQYFTVYELEFQKQVNEWVKNDVVVKWASMFASTQILEHRDTKLRYRGNPTMRTLCLEMAKNLNFKQQTKVVRIEQNEDKYWNVISNIGERFNAKTLIMTLPLPQILELCYRSGVIPSNKTVTYFSQQKYHECTTLLIVSDQDSEIPEPGGLWFEDQNPIRWMSDNKIKGISDLTAVTIHLSPEFSKKTNQTSEIELFSELEEEIKKYIPGDWIHKSIHRWKYSQPTNIVDLGFLKDEYYQNLWFTGDVFINGRVESAWMAGYRTAKTYLKEHAE